MFGILMGVGMGISLLGSMNQAKATEDAARYNKLAAEEDIKLMKIEENQKSRIMREQGARQVGNVKAAASMSGVKLTSGSVLDSIVEQASINAQNEFLLGFEADSQEQRVREAARTGGIAAANQASGQRLAGVGNAMSGAASIYGYYNPR